MLRINTHFTDNTQNHAYGQKHHEQHQQQQRIDDIPDIHQSLNKIDDNPNHSDTPIPSSTYYAKFDIQTLDEENEIFDLNLHNLDSSPSITCNDLPPDHYPELQPRYTSNSTVGSNISLESNSSSSSSSARCSFLSTDQLPTLTSISSAKRIHDAQIQTNIIYERMNQFTPQTMDDEDNKKTFSFIMDDETDDDDQEEDDFSDYDETDDDEEDEEEDDDYNDFYYDDEYDDDEADPIPLNTLTPPSVDVSGLSTVSSSDADDVYYDDGDHDIRLPTEFRSLCVRVDSASFMSPINTIDDNENDRYDAMNALNEYQEYTDDDQEYDDNDNDVEYNDKPQKPTLKIEKHIQNKINIHQQIKQFFNNKTTKTKKNKSKKKQNPKKTNVKNVKSDVECDQHDEIEEKKFDFSVDPNKIRLSESTVQHLLNLITYHSDDDDDDDDDVYNYDHNYYSN